MSVSIGTRIASCWTTICKPSHHVAAMTTAVGQHLAYPQRRSTFTRNQIRADRSRHLTFGLADVVNSLKKLRDRLEMPWETLREAPGRC